MFEIKIFSTGLVRLVLNSPFLKGEKRLTEASQDSLRFFMNDNEIKNPMSVELRKLGAIQGRSVTTRDWVAEFFSKKISVTSFCKKHLF